MTRAENDDLKEVQREANTYEDEINLMDYFLVLWKRKWFIGVGSLLPTLIVGGILFFFCPKNYSVTYMYEIEDKSFYDVRDRDSYNVQDQSSYDTFSWDLNEKNFDVFCNIFYSQENISNIVNKLQENGLAKYAALMSKTGTKTDTKEGPNKFVVFEVEPPYVELSKVNITESTKLEQIRQLKAMLLKLTIIGRPQNDIPRISLVIRNNLENIIPVYLVEKKLNAVVQECRAKMAQIERNRFSVDLELKTDKSILEKLRNITTEASKGEGNITLQFDVGGRSEYLPIEYQIQSTESKVVQLEEQIVADEKRYTYYKDLLTLNEKLLAEIKDKASSYYTIQQFHSFLTGLVDGCENEGLKSYLNSRIKSISNRISASIPVTEKPKVYPIAKGTVKKSGIVFVVSLMIAVFAAFLSEGLKKSQARVL